MEIVVNGEALEIAAGATVADLVRRLDRRPENVAVEHNGEILPRDRYAATALAAGDRVEVVHFVQGGRPPAPADRRRRGGLSFRAAVAIFARPWAASSIGRAADS